MNLQLLSGQLIDLQPVNIKDFSCFQANVAGIKTPLMCSHRDAKALSKKPQLLTEFKTHKDERLKVFVDSVTKDNVYAR